MKVRTLVGFAKSPCKLHLATFLLSLCFIPLAHSSGYSPQESAEPAAAESVDEPAAEATAPDGDAADADAQIGLDKWIDNKFSPVADAWETLVLTPAVVTFEEIVDGVATPKDVKIPIVLLLLVFGALLFTVAFGFINLRLIPFAIRVVSGKYDDIEKAGADEIKHVEVNEADGDLVDTIRDEGESGEVSHFQALATAVSGTVGLGNISGVALAVAVGGPGATFWMIICGLLGMSTKFVECTLGVKYRDLEPDGTVHGGPMYYLNKALSGMGLEGHGRLLGFIFALLCVGASFGGGNMFQSNQATAQITTLVGYESGSTGAIIGVIMAVLVGIVIIGGIKRIATVTEKVVPFMAIIYVGAALVIIAMNIRFVPTAITQIFTGAFNPEAGLGGMMGVIIVGFQRAAFSNEAGAGSAAIAHSAVKTRYPASEGVVALLEPFIDTVVICTMTALVIVLFNINGDASGAQALFTYGDVDKGVLIDGARVGGVDLTSQAFDTVLPGFRYVLTIAIILFAFSTMISWSYYGLQSWKYLFGRGQVADMTYKLLFCLFVVIGAAASLDAVVKFSDAMILALVFPNMVGLLLLFPKVREELARYMAAIKNG